MDLPTYTSIWRIEKRLYKLYDFRLPMPLPVGQLAVFAAIAVPYLVLLQVFRVPFNHTLIWLYILPPGLLTWLATRPVLEGKRLPELVKSQLRYLAEPRVWCRMAPSSERDVVRVSGRVWRTSASARRAGPAPASAAFAVRAQAAFAAPAAVRSPAPSQASGYAPAPVAVPQQISSRPPLRVRVPAPAPVGTGPEPGEFGHETSWAAVGERIYMPGLDHSARQQPADVEPATAESAASDRAADPPDSPASPPGRAAEPAGGEPPAEPAPEPAEPDSTAAAAEASAPEPPPRRPVVTVVGPPPGQRLAPAVERAIAGPSARRGEARPGRVTVVPGGHRPGKPDRLQRDRLRAQQPVAVPQRIIVLGCTDGAGQTVTALLTGEVLAGLRDEPIAVLDLNPGPGSLARRSLARPALSQAASLGTSRLTVLGPQRHQADDRTGHTHSSGPDPAADVAAFEFASDQFDLVIADPSTAAVPRLLSVADQLVLVAPASSAAAGAIAMTYEWLDAHGQGDLAAAAIMVMNGVSRRSVPHVEQAERVCVGRCRAIVRVPWDDQLNNHGSQRGRPGASGPQPQHRWAGLLSPPTVGAYTALAGVLVAALAERGGADPALLVQSHSGQAAR